MKIDIKEFQDIAPKLGGVRSSVLSLGKTGYFRLNKYFIKEYNLEKKRFVNIKAIKRENRIIVALNFSEQKSDSSFSLSHYESKDKKIKSVTFSGRGVFSQFNINHKSVIKDKSLKLKPEIQDHDGIKYFIVEIPLKN